MGLFRRTTIDVVPTWQVSNIVQQAVQNQLAYVLERYEVTPKENQAEEDLEAALSAIREIVESCGDPLIRLEASRNLREWALSDVRYQPVVIRP